MAKWQAPSPGSGQPKRRNVWVPVAIFTALGLPILGSVVDFIPAKEFQSRFAIFAFAGIGLWGAVLLYRAMLKRERTSVWQTDLKTWLMLPFLVALLGVSAWFACSKAVPWAITSVFGTSYHLKATMQTDRVHSAQLCDYRLKGGPLVGTMPSFICISPDDYRRFPDQTVEVMLEGKVTRLGFAINSASHISGVKDVHGD